VNPWSLGCFAISDGDIKPPSILTDFSPQPLSGLPLAGCLSLHAGIFSTDFRPETADIKPANDILSKKY
jgi:hypothetical protein